jgi:hypothetical protein
VASTSPLAVSTRRVRIWPAPVCSTTASLVPQGLKCQCPVPDIVADQVRSSASRSTRVSWACWAALVWARKNRPSSGEKPQPASPNRWPAGATKKENVVVYAASPVVAPTISMRAWFVVLVTIEVRLSQRPPEENAIRASPVVTVRVSTGVPGRELARSYIATSRFGAFTRQVTRRSWSGLKPQLVCEVWTVVTVPPVVRRTARLTDGNVPPASIRYLASEEADDPSPPTYGCLSPPGSSYGPVSAQPQSGAAAAAGAAPAGPGGPPRIRPRRRAARARSEDHVRRLSMHRRLVRPAS